MSTLKETVKPDQTFDARGMGCPMPLLKTKKAIEPMGGGQVLEVLATDPGAIKDLASWGEKTGNEYLGYTEEGGYYKHYIRKKSS
jgi:TusA-related sulfurtransferase